MTVIKSKKNITTLLIYYFYKKNLNILLKHDRNKSPSSIIFIISINIEKNLYMYQ